MSAEDGSMIFAVEYWRSLSCVVGLPFSQEDAMKDAGRIRPIMISARSILVRFLGNLYVTLCGAHLA
jgi:hypothetical protein